MTRKAALLFALTAANAAYILDQGWPAGIQPYIANMSRITAVAVANGTSGSTEIHVAQRGLTQPPVFVFDVSGKLLRTWGMENVVSLHGLHSQPGTPSTVWATDIEEATVKQFNITGALLRTVGTADKPGNGVDPVQFSAPADIAITPAGNVIVSDGDGGTNNRVLDLLGDNLSVIYGVGGLGTGPSQFNSPHSVAFEAANSRFWVADRGNTRLQAFLADTGVWVGEWSAKNSCFPGIPWGVRIHDALQRMIVADGTNMAVYVLQMEATSSRYNIGNCTLLQTIPFANGTTPHELAVDQQTGDFYVAGVGAIPTIQRYTEQ